MFNVREPKELESVIAEIGRKRVDALVVPEYSMFVAHARTIARLASAQRLPTIGFNELAEAGGLLGYGYDAPDLFRRAAVFVDKILKGARPADLPVERATKIEWIVNRTTAQALGVTISQAGLVRADRLIE